MPIDKLPSIFRDEATVILKNKLNELIDAFNTLNSEQDLLIDILQHNKIIKPFATAEDKQEPLNCPWCNTTGKLNIDTERQYEKYYIICPNMYCMVNPITNYFETTQEAINAWNKRA